MRTDVANGQAASRKRGFWPITLVLIAVLAVLLATRDDDSGASDMAVPITRGSGNPAMPKAAGGLRTPVSRTQRERERQLAEALSRALAPSAPRADFPPLSNEGRLAWESRAAPSPPSSPVQATPSASMAPAMPFQWVGLWEQPAASGVAASAPMAIIAGSRTTRIVRQGDLLEEDWKVEKISAEQIHLTYLPLHLRQTLSMNKP